MAPSAPESMGGDSMVWEWIRRGLSKGRSGSSPENQPHEVRWLDAADNPWGVPVLDVRPVTLGMLSTTTDRRCAENAISFGQDDGTSFIGLEPQGTRTVGIGLRFSIDHILADGALFIPMEMEHKWAIYFHHGQLIFIRSWLRKVQAVAETQIRGDLIEITDLRGAFVAPDEEPSFTVRVLDYLLRTHALGKVYPAPIPPGMEADPGKAALWCFSAFGNLAHFATPHVLPTTPPEQPLRTCSLLHLATARGEIEKVKSLLDAGWSTDLLASDGLAPLHWALVRDDTAIPTLLLQRGSSIDVRSAEGATPLMNAVQGRSVEKVTFLLNHGADPNALDQRGFTALHRAAEMGESRIVQSLLDHGAFPHTEAQGRTPLSLAEERGEKEVVRLLRSR
jgi:Ankyrin repeats (3 copies)